MQRILTKNEREPIGNVKNIQTATPQKISKWQINI